MANVRFVRTTKEKQINRQTYDNNALYFCIDSGELYRGSQLLSDGVRQIASYSALPEFTLAADGILYYTIDTGNAYLLNEARDAWLQVVFAPVADIDTITDEDADKYVPTVGAVRKALEGISVSDGGEAYELPIATDTTLGGVIAAAKTDDMTQEIGVDENGKLWVSVPDVTAYVTQEYVDTKVETVETQVETMEIKIETMETKIEEVAGGLDPNETYIFDGGNI